MMKKPFLQNKTLPLLWAFFHVALIAAFLVSLFINGAVRFNTSLFDILPPSHSLKNAAQADARLSERTSRAVTILSYSDDFSSAKRAAEQLYSLYRGGGNLSQEYNATPTAASRQAFFEDLTLFVDAAATKELTDFIVDNRFMLLDGETVSLLENNGAAAVSQDALGRIFGSFSLTDFSALERDPFDLAGGIVLRFVDAAGTNGAMGIKDDVLAAEKDGLWYVLLRGTVSPAAVSLVGRNSAVRDIYGQCGKISTQSRQQPNGHEVRFAFSGVPFHSYESSRSAQRQVSVISTIGMILVILLFLHVFRSIVPALVSAGAVAFSCGMALVSVLLAFHEIHILTFVFGTTLIGTCVDYSIHFFVHWKNDAGVSDGMAIRKKILRGIGISFVSTEICFAALFLAPFPFLRQVSVFLFTGLLSAFLGVVCLYPYLSLPRNRNLSPSASAGSSRKARWFGLFQQDDFRATKSRQLRNCVRFIPPMLFVASLILIAANRHSLNIDNNLRDMYTMSRHLLESEKITSQVLNYGSSGWYFLVEGADAEEVLQTEEAFSARLEEAKSDGTLGNYLAASSFVPSQKTQMRSYRAASALLPLAGDQFAALGFAQNASEKSALAAQYAAEFNSAENHYLTPETALPAILASVTKNLWLGEIGGRWYSCILPLHAQDEAFFRSLSASFPAVHFVNKTADIGSELNALTATMLKLMAGAFVLVIIMLFFFYPPKTVLRIAAIPLLVALATVAVLAAAHISLGFFSVTGLVLTFGLGLDYVIYAIEGEKSGGSLNTLAILISFATTALSFGALAFIDFAPVHTIGLTVAVGLTTACLSAMSVGGKKHNAPHF